MPKFTTVEVKATAMKWYIKKYQSEGWETQDIICSSNGMLLKAIFTKDNERLTLTPKKEKRKRAYKLSTSEKMNPKELEGYMGAQAYLEAVQMNQEIMQLQKDHKLDLTILEEVEKRISDYFEIIKKYKNKPTVAGLSLALGINKEKLGAIMAGRIVDKNYPSDVVEYLNTVYNMLESLWEGYMLDGNIPSQNGIFIGKNQFGYKDVVEQKVTAEVKPKIDTEQIKMKYVGSDYEIPEKSSRKKKKDNDDD